MKTIPQCHASFAALLVATLVSGVTGFAQAPQTQTRHARGTQVAPRVQVQFVSENPSSDPRVAVESETARAETPEKFLFHVSDRAQRGRVQPSKLRAPGVLPELVAGVSEEPRDPLVLRPNDPASES